MARLRTTDSGLVNCSFYELLCQREIPADNYLLQLDFFIWLRFELKDIDVISSYEP